MSSMLQNPAPGTGTIAVSLRFELLLNANRGRNDSRIPFLVAVHWNVSPDGGLHAQTKVVQKSAPNGANAINVHIPHACIQQPAFVRIFTSVIDRDDNVRALAQVAEDAFVLPGARRGPVAIRSTSGIEVASVYCTDIRLPPGAVRLATVYPDMLPPNFYHTTWGGLVISANESVYKGLQCDNATQFVYKINTNLGPLPVAAYAYSAYRDAVEMCRLMDAPSSRNMGPQRRRSVEAWFVHLLTTTKGLLRLPRDRRLSTYTKEQQGNIISDMVTLPGRALVYMPDFDYARVNNNLRNNKPTVIDQWMIPGAAPAFGQLGFDCEDHSHFILFQLYVLQLYSHWQDEDLQTVHSFLSPYFMALSLAQLREPGSPNVAHIMVMLLDSSYVQLINATHEHAASRQFEPTLVIDSTQHADAVWTQASMDRATGPAAQYAARQMACQQQVFDAWPGDVGTSSLRYRLLKMRMNVHYMHVRCPRYGLVTQLFGVFRDSSTLLHVLCGRDNHVGVPLADLVLHERHMWMKGIVSADLSVPTNAYFLAQEARSMPTSDLPRAPPRNDNYDAVFPPVTQPGMLVTICIRSEDSLSFSAAIARVLHAVRSRTTHQRKYVLDIDDSLCKATILELWFAAQ